MADDELLWTATTRASSNPVAVSMAHARNEKMFSSSGPHREKLKYALPAALAPQSRSLGVDDECLNDSS